ncbi:MAG: hypothetical protein OEM97_02565 [Acidimicrobiia bacterium]|nr:hypothetical protein [Acidimicrobiia bacterium]
MPTKGTTIPRRILLLFVIAGFFLASCEARFDSNVVVNDDESGVVTIELALDDELRQLLEEQGGEQFLGFGDQLADVPEGWTSEEFTEGVFQGVRVSTEFGDFAELEVRLAGIDEQLGQSELSVPATFRTLGLSRDGDTFSFRADVGDAAAGLDALGDQEVGGLDVAQIIDTIFTIRFIVTLPGEIVQHNADSIDGSTLVWQVNSTDATSVLFATSDAMSGPSAASIAGVAAVAAFVIGLALFGVARSRRRRAEELAATRLVDAGND